MNQILVLLGVLQDYRRGVKPDLQFAQEFH